jgi:hypothetical protein
MNARNLHKTLATFFVATTVALQPVLAETPPNTGHFATLAAAVRPTSDELKWQNIPWLLDLMEARKTAQLEDRLLLVWATGDDPLERC